MPNAAAQKQKSRRRRASATKQREQEQAVRKQKRRAKKGGKDENENGNENDDTDDNNADVGGDALSSTSSVDTFDTNGGTDRGGSGSSSHNRGGRSRSTGRKKKRPTSNAAHAEKAGTEIKDSMLVAIKNKRKENANANERKVNRETARKRVSLSESTLQRDLQKNGAPMSLEEAMGKIMPQAKGKLSSPPASRSSSPDASMDTEASDEETSPPVSNLSSKSPGNESAGSRSALKPSRYGRKKPGIASSEDDEAPVKTEGKRASFQMSEYSSSDDEKSDVEDAPSIARRIRQARAPQSDGLSDDADERPPKWTRGLKGQGGETGPERENSWKPEGLSIGTVRRAESMPAESKRQFRRSSSGIPDEHKDEPITVQFGNRKNGADRHRNRRAASSDDSYAPQRSFEEDLQGSVTFMNKSKSRKDSMEGSFSLPKRQGIKRRNSMGNISSAQRNSIRKNKGSVAFADDPHEINDPNGQSIGSGSQAGSEHHDVRNTLLSSLKSTANLNQAKQQRRIAMSVRDQTYIPPKSRESSVLQAMGHLMAGRLIDLTLWTYSAGFAKVMFFFLAFYIGSIFIFAAVLDAVDLASGGRCIHEDAELLTRSERYEFVFELSWATFTTVGYGTISPKGDTTGCYPIRFTCAFVAFIGVLFASTTAAIMYSKLMRLLAKAHVTFSSTLCVQYGKGNEGSTVRFGQLNFRASVAPAALLKEFSASDLLKDDEDEDPSGSEDGFPVIEFRMINDRANHEGSEIWDAQIRGIVQLHKEMPKDNNEMNNASFRKEKPVVGGESTLDLEKKVYYPISLSPETHPHFSRIWYARHVLNDESPLLKREIRDMIVKDGRKWDKDFNNWEEIRDCLNEFISLRITLSGTSAVSASDVYGEHVYQFDDVCVGWRFANMVYEKKERVYKSLWRSVRSLGEGRQESGQQAETRTKIDADLLHDIVPQPGGDHEPLDETKNLSSMAPATLFKKIMRKDDDSEEQDVRSIT